MAISKKGLRKIQVADETFLWKVRKKVSHEEAHDDQLGIPIYYEKSERLLIVFVGYCRSEYPNRVSIQSITPSIIKSKILEAIELGWDYKAKGKIMSLVNGELITDTRMAKFIAG